MRIKAIRERAEKVGTSYNYDNVDVFNLCAKDIPYLLCLVKKLRELLERAEEAEGKPCPTCIARRGIDKCRPGEAFHVTHYDAEEMNMDPLPDKPCECGGE